MMNPTQKQNPVPSRRLRNVISRLAALSFIAAALGLPAPAQEKPAAPPPDVIVFKNGDQLTGTFERSIGDKIMFKSDAVGEVTVPLDKVKELRSSSNFVLLKKDEKVTRASRQAGPVTIEESTIKETLPNGTIETMAIKDVGYVIDGKTYNKELNANPGPFQGWNGAITGGATVLQSTSYGQTFTAGASLVRLVPTVGYLPPRTRTTFNLLETYGKLTQPTVPQTAPPTPDSVAKTNIFHTDFEHDKYFSPRFYMLGNVMFDHNYSQGLDFQQIYGVGAGYTVLQTPIHQLDVKGDLHYERQNFFENAPPAISSPNQDLIGSTFAEAYKRTLPGKILLTESGTYIQSWNNTDAWSAIGAFGLALPVYHRFSLSVNLLDNYLNNPAFGYRKNSLQFVTGVTYTLH
jgi:Protein of unknown function, DUF481